MAGGGEEHDDNPHRFLSVVPAVAQAVDAGGEQLEPAEERCRPCEG